MGLTDGVFVAFVIVLAMAGLAAVVWLWPRLAGSTVRAVAARVGMVAVSEVLVITAFLVCLNSYFSFYSSWSALLGAGTARVVGTSAYPGRPSASLLTVTAAGPAPLPGAAVRDLQRIRPVQVDPASLDLTGSNKDAASELAKTGELLSFSVTGQYTGISVTGDYIYLPPQYFQAAYARSKFPAVLALTGYPGSPWSFVARLGLPAEIAAVAEAGKVRPAVYVLMNSSVAMPRDTECTNIPAGPQVETFFTVDVPRAIEQAFRVQSEPGGWGALGVSTGGYCTVKMAMMDPRQYPAAVSLAGYYTALQDHTTGDLYGGSTSYRDENSPDWRLTHLPAPPVSVLVTSSVIGEQTYPGTLAFLRLIRPPMRGYSLILPEGGHNFRTWDRELPASLEWLSQRLHPAVPR